MSIQTTLNLFQAQDKEYAFHIYWDRKDPDAPEGWIPNMPTKSLKLSETALDSRYD